MIWFFHVIGSMLVTHRFFEDEFGCLVSVLILLGSGWGESGGQANPIRKQGIRLMMVVQIIQQPAANYKWNWVLVFQPYGRLPPPPITAIMIISPLNSSLSHIV